MTLHVHAQRVQFLVDLCRKVKSNRKSLDAKGKAKRAIKEIFARRVGRSKIRITGGKRLQDRHQLIVCRAPVCRALRDSVRAQLDSWKRAQFRQVASEARLVEQPDQPVCLVEQLA